PINQEAPRGMTSSKNKKTTSRPAPRPVELAAPQPAVPRATQRQGFKTNEFIVYPSHGVGQIVAIEEQEVAGYKLELFVINFVKDKMTLRVPTGKIASVGMRKLAEGPMVRKALETLKGPRASSAPCGLAGRRNTTPRSTPATSSRSPRWYATS